MVAALKRMEPVAPSPADAKAAGEAVRRLNRLVQADQSLRLAPEADGVPVELPPVAVALLMRLLKDLAAGNAVTLIPIHAELTTQMAADLLGVSRPFVIKLIDENRLPHHMAGTHRRILFKDLMAYKRAMDAARDTALQELADDSQENEWD